MPSSSNGDPNEQVETQLGNLRQSLNQMEACVGEMMAMLYNVDLFLEQPQVKGVGGKDPKAALEHVSELFHVSVVHGGRRPSALLRHPGHHTQMYQSELLSKREALSDLTCEDIQADEFAARWSSMKEVQDGRKQAIDGLADLLAGLG